MFYILLCKKAVLDISKHFQTTHILKFWVFSIPIQMKSRVDAHLFVK